MGLGTKEIEEGDLNTNLRALGLGLTAGLIGKRRELNAQNFEIFGPRNNSLRKEIWSLLDPSTRVQSLKNRIKNWGPKRGLAGVVQYSSINKTIKGIYIVR